MLKLPAKNAPATPANVKALTDGLTSVIAEHPQATQPWTFYEEVDAYLGPWGSAGYPIGYGKYYCQLFNEDEGLMGNERTAEWVRKTTVALQEPLRDLIADRFKAGRLTSLTAAEFQDYAFSVHAAAYSDSGLGLVLLFAPQYLPVIMSIPKKQYVPFMGNFLATVLQIDETIARVGASAIGYAAGAMFPVESGFWQRAAAQDALVWGANNQQILLVQWCERVCGAGGWTRSWS